jgi:hypothetical protein
MHKYCSLQKKMLDYPSNLGVITNVKNRIPEQYGVFENFPQTDAISTEIYSTMLLGYTTTGF